MEVADGFDADYSLYQASNVLLVNSSTYDAPES